MKYFLDTEFIEGPQKTWWGGKTKPTIDLISIGIKREDGGEYYSVSSDFNLKEAWGRFDLVDGRREYWIRENVLKPIWGELASKDCLSEDEELYSWKYRFSFKSIDRLIKKYGKSNRQISEEVKRFVYNPESVRPLGTEEPIDFYTYYGDYDWVAFCWLFGKMMDLPKGVPMYARDLKQMMDEKVGSLLWKYGRDIWSNKKRSIKDIGKGESQEKDREATFEEKLKVVKELKEYPKQTNQHNALADARWNFELYKFLKNI